MGQTLEGAGSRAGSAAAGMVDRLFCVSSRVVCGDAGAGDRANLVGPLAGVEGARGRRGGGGRVGDGDRDSPEPWLWVSTGGGERSVDGRANEGEPKACRRAVAPDDER